MGTSVMELPRTTVGTGKTARRLARTAMVTGGILSFTTLALSSAQLYSVWGAKLGPGAFMLSIPKHVCGAFAPFIAAAGAAGAASGLLALWLRRGKAPETATKTAKRPGLAGPLIVLAGLSAAAMSVVYTQQVIASRADFAAAFGVGWQEQIPARLKDGMLARRWTWKLPAAQGAHVERNVAFAVVPGSDRELLADVWSPPDGVAPSGLGFIYLHGGGYSAFDKGGPTEFWFRHLAAQGHVVMDVAYRLIPETNMPAMQGDVKRAIAWLKDNAARYGVNPDNLVIGGGSAGSHLALLAAYAPDHPLFTPDDVRGADLSVRGVIGFYNPGDYRREGRVVVKKNALEQAVSDLLFGFLERWTGTEIATDDTGDWDPQLFLGGRPDEWTELYRQVSPITHVGPDAPPTLQIMGEHDVYVSRTPVVAELHEALQEAGVPSIMLRLPRTDHAFDLFFPQVSPPAQTAMYHVDRFLALMAAPAE